MQNHDHQDLAETTREEFLFDDLADRLVLLFHRAVQRPPIPRQAADRVEQTRPERIVQVLRLKLLGYQREIAANVGDELRRNPFRRRGRHQP